MRKNRKKGGDFYRLIWGKALPSAGIFRFERSRREAREFLRLVSAKRKLSILDYCVIPGEMMILADASREEASSMTRSVFSSVSRTHNIRKHHEGSCWKGRPHVALIQKGGCLEAALSAIDMLPVARGLVSHPAEWECSGFQELAGMKERYRIVDRNKLRSILGFENFQDFSRWHLSQIGSAMRNKGLCCFPFDSVAVGDEATIRTIASLLPGKLREIRRCKITGKQAAAGLYTSKRWENSISRRF